MRITALLFLLLPAIASANCGGDFSSFKTVLAAEAPSHGVRKDVAERCLGDVRKSDRVLRADRAQGVFQRPFIDFSRRLISQNRLQNGQRLVQRHAAIFDQVERNYGVDRTVLLAFWAFETDYGAFQGDFNTADALVTLAHDCRRPALFRPQVFAAMTLFARGQFDPRTTTGAWAGEIGMVQMLPADIIENGVDGDGDGRVNLGTSAADALLSGGKMLRHLGWRAGEPWLQEVRVPDQMDWSQSGLSTVKSTREWQRLGVRARAGTLADLPASLILPQGHKGPAFLAYPNFNVYFEWNQSFTYVLTAAYFATRLGGAPVYDAGAPEAGLDGAQMKALQRKLNARGYDVGGVDGILGARTRAAVQAEQKRLGLPADAWPTPRLLDQL